MNINFFTIAGLSVSIFCLILGILIFKHAKNRTHNIWGIFNIVVASWGLGSYLAGSCNQPYQIVISWKFAYLAAAFIAVAYYHFIYLYCGLNRKTFLIFAYAQGIFFSLLILLTNWIIGPLILIFNSIHYHKATPWFNVFYFFWWLVTIAAFVELFKFSKLSSGLQKIHATYLFWCMLIGFIGGTSSVIPAYGIPMYPTWHLSICIYAILIVYGIFRYKLLDIEIVVRKSLIYSAAIALISLIYLILVVSTEKLLQTSLGYRSTLLSILGAFGLGVIFIPIRNYVQSYFDKTFFKNSPIALAEENEFLRKEVVDKEKFKAVAALASGVAHEIKNPLTALNTFIEYFPQKKNDPEFLEKFTKVADKEVVRINELVQELLDFAKPSPLHLQPTSIPDIIDQSLNLLSNHITKNDIRVVKNISSDSSDPISADSNKLKQAFINLFMNAIEAMPTGGTLTVIAQRIQNTLHITISDTGHGIDSKDLPHIFEPFYSKKEKGTGLGLAIVKGIIEDHQGTIRSISKINQGTTFNLKFLTYIK